MLFKYVYCKYTIYNISAVESIFVFTKHYFSIFEGQLHMPVAQVAEEQT